MHGAAALAEPERTGERARLEAVRRYDILDTPPDTAFDRVATLAARIFDVPIATVTIVDEKRIWFKATHGIEVTEVGRDPGLCASAILQDVPLVISDALEDPAALNNPLVRGELGVRFYAAAPIITSDGYRLGTVNAIDLVPRVITTDQVAALQDLAAIVVDELELRLAARRMIELERTQREQIERIVDELQVNLLPAVMPEIPGLDLAGFYRPAGDHLKVGGDFYDVFAHGDGWGLVVGDVCGKGPEAAAVMGVVRHQLRALAELEQTPSTLLRSLNRTLVVEARERYCTLCFLHLERTDGGLRLTVCAAGHPLPFLRRASGELLPVGRHGNVLGVIEGPMLADDTVELAPGDSLLLYTDGLLDNARRPYDATAAALGVALDPAGGAHEVVERIRRTVLPGAFEQMRDDVALLAGVVTQ